MKLLWVFISISALMLFPMEGCRDTGGGKTASKAASGKIEDFSEANFNLSDYRGKVVLLNFWATWCPPCRAELPHLASIYREYKDRGFEIVGISLGEELSHVRSFLEGKGVSYRVLVDKEGNSPKTVVGDVIRGIPTSYLIDRDGKILKRYLGYPGDAVIRKDIEGLISK